MARPSTNCDGRLLDAGIQILREEGLSGLGVRNVCHRAGVNLGMFTYHFATKENFQRQLLVKATDILFDGLSDGLTTVDFPNEDDPLKALSAALEAFVLRVHQEKSLAMALFIGCCQGDELTIESSAHRLPRHFLRLMDLVNDCRKRGVIRGDLSDEQIILMVVSGVVLPILWSKEFIDRLDPNGHVSTKRRKEELSSVYGAKLRLAAILDGLRPVGIPGPLPAIRRLATRVGLIGDGADENSAEDRENSPTMR